MLPPVVSAMAGPPGTINARSNAAGQFSWTHLYANDRILPMMKSVASHRKNWKCKATTSTCLSVAVLGLIFAAVDAAAVAQDAREPLLMPGKQTLYQRVLTRPGAALSEAPGGKGTAGVPAFTIFHVYDRREAGGAGWVEVGAASRGPADGWLPADKLIDWKQSIAVSFANPAGRERALLFRDADALLGLLEADDLVDRARELRAQALAGPVPPGFPVVSIEPATHVDIRKQFYLLPILSAEEIYLANGFTTRMLQVASLTRQEAAETPLTEAVRQGHLRAGGSDSIAAFRSAIVFVIDATTSMGPYIDRTREAVRQVYDELAAAGLDDKVAFGMIAYRDNVEVAPGLEYVTRLYVDPNDGLDKQGFLEQVASVAPAKVSSRGFAEDAYAGVAEAVRGIDWSPFGGRYVVLISDAGARPGNDPLASTGMDGEQLNLLAREEGIAVYAVHLLTKAGAADHQSAAAQYAALSHHPVGGALYFPVAAGAVEGFSEHLRVMSETLTRQIAETSSGRLARPAQATAAESSELDRLAAATRRVGYAMQLAYLGASEDTQAPTLFNAWLADRDFENPDTAALEVRVLLTKNQLSDLQSTLRTIVETAKLAQVSPGDFFDQLRSAAAAMSRNPADVGLQQARSIAELGLLGEYIDGLPYRSKVMSFDEDLWLSWSVGEQQAFIDEIEAKIALYQSFHDDTDRWVALDGGRVPGDAVYPVPLEALP